MIEALKDRVRGRIRLSHGLLHKGENFLSAVCYHSPGSLFQQMMANVKESGYTEIYRNSFLVKTNQKFPIRMEGLNPDLHNFRPPERLLTPADITFDGVQLPFLLEHLKEPQDEVEINYIVDEFEAALKVRLRDTKDIERKSEHRDSNEGSSTQATFFTGSSVDRGSVNVSKGVSLLEDKKTSTDELPSSISAGTYAVTRFGNLSEGISLLEDKKTSTDDLPSSVTAGPVRTCVDAGTGVVTRFGKLSEDVSMLEDKKTSTDDLHSSITAGAVRMCVDAETGVVTRLGNLSGGLAISKSIRKVIGLESKCLHVGDCSAGFLPDSFTESTPVTVKTEIDSTKWPKNFMAFTPTLYVDAKGLKRKVQVKLPSWCVQHQPGKVVAHILHIPEGSTEWKDTNVTLPVTDKPYFEFEWQDFSSIMIGVWYFWNTVKLGILNWFRPNPDPNSVHLRIAGGIYVSNANEISIAYHINDGTAPTSKSLAHDDVKSRMDSINRNMKIPIDEFTVLPGDTIETQVRCDDPDELVFKPEDFTFTIDEAFGEKNFVHHHGIVTGNLAEIQLIDMQFVIYKKSGQERQKIGNAAMFTFDWIPKRGRAKEQRKSKESQEALLPLMRDVNIHQGAKIQFSESGTSTTVTRNITHEGSRKTINAMKMADNGSTFTATEHDAKNTLAVQTPSGDTSTEGLQENTDRSVTAGNRSGK